MSRRLVAWACVGPVYGRAFLDPALATPGEDIRNETGSLLDAVMVTRRLKREQEAAGIELVRAAGHRAWDIHHGRQEGT